MNRMSYEDWLAMASAAERQGKYAEALACLDKIKNRVPGGGEEEFHFNAYRDRIEQAAKAQTKAKP